MTTTFNTQETVTGADFHQVLKAAQTATQAGQTTEAEQAWRHALELRPDSPAAALGLCQFLDAQGLRDQAEKVLRDFVAVAPTHANILAAARQWAAWQDTPSAKAKTIRIALTGTGTLNPLGSHLSVACAQIGLHPALYVSDFNQWAQELLPTQSGLYEFAPELIVLLLEPSSLFPKATAAQAQSLEEAAAERKAGLAQISGLLSAAKQHAPTATVVMHTFAIPDYSPLGQLDLKTNTGQYASFEAINADLISLIETQFPKTVLFDQERVESRHGKSRVRDERMWYMASMPFSETFLPAMAAEYVRIIRPFKGLTRKCIVLDLDNTLWGGVIGEDGISHIKIGGTAAPGNAFRDFQIALDGLSRRGILLAACSKNNPDDVWPVFESHPHMVLRKPHFAAMRINWQDKATNIREIARELNIGLDSLVFLDDNPAERGLVRQEVPEVLTVEMPRDPALYTRTLLGLDVFETLSLTKEDQQRSRQYQEQQERQQFEEVASSSGDLTAYLTGLQITAQIAAASVFTLPRIAQLINKTNQFNVTTRRYTEAQVQAMADAPDQWGVYSITVADRFGDSGLTGIAIVKKDTTTWEIDSFLLSCRVLGRGIEAALMTFLVHQAQTAGATHLRGLFIPSPKNEPSAGLFEAQGFQPSEISADGAQNWVLDLVGLDSQYPGWLTIQEVK